MTAPVSLAEIKAKSRYLNNVPRTPTGYVILFDTERDALVELAEAYLALCDQNSQPWKFSADEHGAARGRLALAAKGVRRIVRKFECAEAAAKAEAKDTTRRTARASKARMRYGDFLRAKDSHPDLTFREFMARGFVLRHPDDCDTTIPRGEA